MIGRLRAGLIRATLAAAVGLIAIAAMPASPARADDLTTCVAGWAKKALDPDEIKTALEFMANYGHCVGLLSDPSGQFAAIVTALSVAKEGGAFSTAEQCQNKIPQLLGEVVISVADSVGGVIGLKIPSYVKDQGKDAVVNWVLNEAKKNPVIQSISAEMDCGCAVAVYGVDYLKEVLQTLVQVAEACANLVGEIAKIGAELGKALVGGLTQAAEDLGQLAGEVLDLLEDCLSAAAGQKSVIDCLGEVPDVTKAVGALLGGAAGAVGDFFDALGGVLSWAKPACCGTVGQIWGGFCGGCSPPAKPTPPKVDIGCQGVLCEQGLQCGGELNDRCVPCGDAGGLAGYGKDANLCGCAFGFSPKYKSTPGGPVLTACTCDAPKKTISLIATAVCACPNQGEQVLYAGGQPYCGCPWGESLKGGKCQPIECKPPFALGSDGKNCVQVETISIKDAPKGPVKLAPVFPCPPNYHWDGAKCVYDGPYSIKDQPKSTVKPVPGIADCGPNFRWDGARCAPIGGPALPAKPGTMRQAPIIPPCPPNTAWNGQTCASTLTIQKAPATATRAAPLPPPCPANTKWDGRTCAPVTTLPKAPANIRALPSLPPPCPPNTKWNGQTCASTLTLQRPPTTIQAIPPCPQNTKWDGRRCAPVPPPILLNPQILKPATPTIR